MKSIRATTDRLGTKVSIAAAFALLVMLLPATAFAAGGESSWSWELKWLGMAVNLVVIVAVGVKYAGPGFRKFLAGRKENIDKDIATAETLRKEAETRLDELETKIASLDSERAAIIDEYKSMGQSERGRIIEQAERDAQRIRDDAARWSETERAKASVAIERQIASLALEMAETKLRKDLDMATQKKLVDQTITQLTALSEQS